MADSEPRIGVKSANIVSGGRLFLTSIFDIRYSIFRGSPFHKKILPLTVLLLVAFLLLPVAASAHKVNLFAYAEGKTVYTESYYPDGKLVVAGKILVYDSGHNLLLEGATNAEGLFSFPIPKVDDLTIVIEAGMGHRNEFLLKKSELKE